MPLQLPTIEQKLANLERKVAELETALARAEIDKIKQHLENRIHSIPKPYSVGQSLEVVSNHLSYNQLDGKIVTVEAVYDNEYGIYYDVAYGSGDKKITFVISHHSLILPYKK